MPAIEGRVNVGDCGGPYSAAERLELGADQFSRDLRNAVVFGRLGYYSSCVLDGPTCDALNACADEPSMKNVVAAVDSFAEFVRTTTSFIDSD